MPDIRHDFPIGAPVERVFDAISLPHHLDQWWTKRSAGSPGRGAEYELGFGPGYDWRAVIDAFDPPGELEYRMIEADPEWQGTRVGFQLRRNGSGTQVLFRHVGWPYQSDHFRTSSFCWAMYLRILRRYLEHGERIPYELRLEV